MTRVLFFGTHPYCYNGYCVVTHNLAKELAKKPDIQLTIYGFQNFYNNPKHMKEREIPRNVYVYDAHANETPKQMGFGFDQIPEFVAMNKPDVCVIYNDMVVVSNVLNKLKEARSAMPAPHNQFKVMVYIDQVYLHQKQEYIKRLNEDADYVLAFTPYWEGVAKELGITKPTGYLQHGFDPRVHFPVPKPLARQYFGLKKDDFIVLNLNRNQPRKRWDTCLQAYADFVSRHMVEPVKLLIATATTGAWNLLEIYERELKKRGFTLEEGMRHIILIDNPQQLADEDINILYNVADVGINTCDGEGFGLCNFEQAAIGTPQIVPHIGGFRDFFDEDNAMLVTPKLTFYIDSGRDGVGGEAQMCDWRDFSAALEKYYTDAKLRESHGLACRRRILRDYRWADLGERFYKQIKDTVGPASTSLPPSIPLNIDITKLMVPVPEPEIAAPITTLSSPATEPLNPAPEPKVLPKPDLIPKKEIVAATPLEHVPAAKAKKAVVKKKNMPSPAPPVPAAAPVALGGLDKAALLALKSKIDSMLLG